MDRSGHFFHLWRYSGIPVRHRRRVAHIDVRSAAAFDADHPMMVGAINRASDAVEAWGRELLATREVVACCIHGREASQGAAAPLRERGGLRRQWLQARRDHPERQGVRHAK